MAGSLNSPKNAGKARATSASRTTTTSTPNAHAVRSSATTYRAASPVASDPASNVSAKWAIVTITAGVIVGATMTATIVSSLISSDKHASLNRPGTAGDASSARPTPIAKKEEIPADLLALSLEVPLSPKSVEPPKMEVAEVSTSTKLPDPKVELNPGKPLPPTFADIEKKGRLLSLPQRVGGLGAAESESGELCKIHVQDPTECDLTLVTSEMIDDQPRLFLQLDEAGSKGKRVWIAAARSSKGLVDTGQTARIGTFQLANQTLTFEWNLAAPPWTKPYGLTLCTLHVRVADQSVPCALFKALPSKPVRLNLAQARQVIPFAGTGQSVASGRSLRLAVELRFGDWSELLNLTADADAKTVVVIPKKIEHGEGNVELELRFVPPSQSQDAELKYGAYPFLPTATEPAVEKMQVPRWVFKNLRSDLIKSGNPPKPVYPGEFILGDFVKIRQPLAKQRKDTGARVQNVKKSLETAEVALRLVDNVKSDSADIKKAKDAVAYWQGMRSHGREFDQYLDDFTAWSVEMEKHFQDLQKNLEVRFSMYMDLTDEVVVLSETDPPPKRTATPAARKSDSPKAAPTRSF